MAVARFRLEFGCTLLRWKFRAGAKPLDDGHPERALTEAADGLHTCSSTNGFTPLIRSLVTFMAALALILVLGPGPIAYASGMGPDAGAAFSAHQDSDGCASTMMPTGQTDRHPAGGCAKMSCCLGAICIVAGLPAMTSFVVPTSATMLNLSAATAALTGRDVAPPFDPPRPFA